MNKHFKNQQGEREIARIPNGKGRAHRSFTRPRKNIKAAIEGGSANWEDFSELGLIEIQVGVTADLNRLGEEHYVYGYHISQNIGDGGDGWLESVARSP